MLLNNGQRAILVRNRMVCSQLERLKNRMTGRDNSFYPFITNRSGEISERKLNSFVNELADFGEDSGRFSFYLSQYDADAAYKKVCKSFLYCAVQGIADYNEELAYPVRTASLFSDIISLAEHKNNLLFDDEETLFRYEFEASMYDEGTFFSEYHEGGFFRYCDALYSLLTGKSITELIPKELYSEMLKTQLDKKAAEQGYSSAEEYESSFSDDIDELADNDEEWKKYLESLDEEQRAEAEQESDAYAEMSEEINVQHNRGMEKFKKEELKSIASPENFVKNYLNFRRLFFTLPKYKRRLVFDDIILSVDNFLSRNGLSPMMNDEMYIEFDGNTDRLYSMMKQRGVN